MRNFSVVKQYMIQSKKKQNKKNLQVTAGNPEAKQLQPHHVTSSKNTVRVQFIMLLRVTMCL